MKTPENPAYLIYQGTLSPTENEIIHTGLKHKQSETEKDTKVPE